MKGKQEGNRAKKTSFAGKKILITGGLGFIGSSLAIALAKQGAVITIVDNLTPNQGGNEFNIRSIRNRVLLNYADIRDTHAMNHLVKGKDFVFHLARQNDHILSLKDPFPDIDINVRGMAVLLEALKIHNQQARLIYVGTRGQYGNQVTLPVSETAPTNPRGIYEITNLTAEKMVSVYHEVHGLQSVMLRLTNVYGPKSQMKHDHYGVVNWFIRLALENKQIPLYGDGSLKRDFLYIDDAIDALILCATTQSCYGEILNVGNNKAETFRELVEALGRIIPTATWKFTQFSVERKAQEPGHFLSDITKINRLTGWKPKITLTQGLRRTVSYYKKHHNYYW
jgi:UDP-glucose 4-epimerase